MLFTIQSVLGLIILFIIDHVGLGNMFNTILVAGFIIMSIIFMIKDYAKFRNKIGALINAYFWYLLIITIVILQLTLGDKIKLP